MLRRRRAGSAGITFVLRRGTIMLQRITRGQMLRLAAIGGVLLLGLGSAWAAQVGRILSPVWPPPTKGTYAAPAEEIGKKSSDAQPWSVTTVASSIKGQVVPGKSVTVVGEIID